jgi:hypothetical protein
MRMASMIILSALLLRLCAPAFADDGDIFLSCEGMLGDRANGDPPPPWHYTNWTETITINLKSASISIGTSGGDHHITSVNGPRIEWSQDWNIFGPEGSPYWSTSGHLDRISGELRDYHTTDRFQRKIEATRVRKNQLL